MVPVEEREVSQVSQWVLGRDIRDYLLVTKLLRDLMM